MAFEIVSRDRWGSTSKWKYGNLTLPVKSVYLHHTVTAVTAFPYKLRMQDGAAAGTLTMVSSSGSPAFILVEDIGAA